MHLYGLLHQYSLYVIRLYYQHLPLVLLQPLIVHSVFWLWTVQLLSSKLTALETKMCGKMMVITSHFKDELQSLKKCDYASNWSIRNCTVERDSSKNQNQGYLYYLWSFEDTNLFSQKFTAV